MKIKYMNLAILTIFFPHFRRSKTSNITSFINFFKFLISLFGKISPVTKRAASPTQIVGGGGRWVWCKKFWNPLTCFKRKGGRKNPNYSNLEKSWIQNLTLIFEVSVRSKDISQIGRKTTTTLTNASHLRAKTGCTNAKIFWHGPNPH